MKNIIILIIIIFLTNFCNGQVRKTNFDNFSNNFKQLQLPLVFDQITLKKLSSDTEKLSYSEIKKYIVDEEKKPLINLNDTINNNFYSFGKIKLQNMDALIFSEVNTHKSIFISIFNKLGELRWFSKLCSTESFDSSLNNNYASMILEDNMFLKVDKNSYLTVEIFEPNEDILFSSYECIDYSKCYLYSPRVEQIPIREDLNLKIDSSFFNTVKLLIPIKFCSPIKTTQVLSSIGNENNKSLDSYFIGSKTLEGDKKIIFFLNIFDYNNYLNVREVGYQVMDKNGKLIKIDNFYEYAETKEGIPIINKTGEIKDLNDKIEIYSYEYGNINYVKYGK